MTTVLVTGAARGVGRATAIAFAQRGADLMLVDACLGEASSTYSMPAAADLESAAKECRDHGSGRVITEIADVRDHRAVSRAADTWRRELPHLSVVVNGAGVIGAPKPAHLLSEDEWAAVIDTNLGGAWRITRAAVPSMIESGRGSIVNVASTAGLIAFPSFAGYVAAKHGLVGLTRALALDYAPYGIRVNAVCPTSIVSEAGGPSMLGGVAEMLGITLADYVQLVLPNHPMGELPTDADIAAAIIWLASEDARHVTGVALPIDSGFTAR